MASVVVYTRQGCPLCEKGISAVRSVFGAGEVSLVDIDLDLALLERFDARVPVVTTAAGDVIDEGIVDIATLEAFRNRR